MPQKPIIRPARLRLRMPAGGCALWLAVTATTTTLALSSLAGWQRGGSQPERAVWVALGVVLILCAHLLPTLIRGSPPAVRLTGSLLWGTCMVTACYGHVYFFLLAQQHAGESRASDAVPVVMGPAALPLRPLGAVMQERAGITRQLALSRAQRCVRDCPLLDARRVTLAARLDALDAEADDIRRRHAEDDRTTARRDALLIDPVTSRLAALLHVTGTRVDLLSGVLFAAVLEGVACLLWTVALRPLPAAVAPVTGMTGAEVAAGEAVTAVTQSHDSETGSHAPRNDPVTPLPDPADDDVTRLVRDIAAGRLRPTVAGIRQYLGCSQARAASLRKQIALPPP